MHPIRLTPRPISRLTPRSALRPVSALARRPGLTFSHAVAFAGSGPSADRPAAEAHLNRGAPLEASASLSDLSLATRLTGAFVIVAFLVICMAFLTGLQIDRMAAEGADAAQAAKAVLFGFAGITAVGCVALGLAVARSIGTPITKITQAMDRLAAGDADTAIPAAAGADEIGRMARAIAVFKDDAVRVQRLLKEREGEQARRRIEAERKQQRLALARELGVRAGEQIETVDAEMVRLSALSARLNADNSEANAQARALSETASDGAARAESLADSVDRLTRATRQIRERIEESAAMASRANRQAEATKAEIAGLVDATEDITAVIDLIKDISEKTKILALNAQVEAMRAGPAGRTFIVVAEEVKTLAAETASAVGAVGAHVDGVRERTGRTADNVRAIIEAVAKIDAAASEASAAVAEQAETSRSIAEDAARAREQSRAVRDDASALSDRARSSAEAAAEADAGAASVGEALEALNADLTGFLSEAEKLETGT